MDEDARSSWSDLPSDMLRLIESRLPPQSLAAFASVCQGWRQCSSHIVYLVDRHPLLLHSPTPTFRDSCGYYDPVSNIDFAVDSSHNLFGTQPLFAKDGWLMLAQRFHLILVNPFSATPAVFFRLRTRHYFTSYAFSCAPCWSTNKGYSLGDDFMIFGVSMLEKFTQACLYQHGRWDYLIQWENNHSIVSVRSPPVYHDDLFYCLGLKGNLGVFNPKDRTWTVLDDTRFSNSNNYKEGFLVELSGKLSSIFLCTGREPVHVFELNRQDMKWNQIWSLGDQTLFYERRMMLSSATSVKEIENKIVLPKVRRKPKTIEVEPRVSRGRVYFVAERRPSNLLKRDEGGIMGHQLLGLDEPCDPANFADLRYCIWFQPKFRRPTRARLERGQRQDQRKR